MESSYASWIWFSSFRGPWNPWDPHGNHLALLEVHIVLAAGATLMVTFAVVMQLGDFLGHTPTDLFTGMESLFFLWFQTHGWMDEWIKWMDEWMIWSPTSFSSNQFFCCLLKQMLPPQPDTSSAMQLLGMECLFLVIFAIRSPNHATTACCLLFWGGVACARLMLQSLQMLNLLSLEENFLWDEIFRRPPEMARIVFPFIYLSIYIYIYWLFLQKGWLYQKNTVDEKMTFNQMQFGRINRWGVQTTWWTTSDSSTAVWQYQTLSDWKDRFFGFCDTVDSLENPANQWISTVGSLSHYLQGQHSSFWIAKVWRNKWVPPRCSSQPSPVNRGLFIIFAGQHAKCLQRLPLLPNILACFW